MRGEQRTPAGLQLSGLPPVAGETFPRAPSCRIRRRAHPFLMGSPAFGAGVTQVRGYPARPRRPSRPGAQGSPALRASTAASLEEPEDRHVRGCGGDERQYPNDLGRDRKPRREVASGGRGAAPVRRARARPGVARRIRSGNQRQETVGEVVARNSQDARRERQECREQDAGGRGRGETGDPEDGDHQHVDRLGQGQAQGGDSSSPRAGPSWSATGNSCPRSLGTVDSTT